MNRWINPGPMAFVVLLGAVCLASSAQAETTTLRASFAGHTAYVVGENNFEIGVFGALRYGLTENVELSTHPLFLFVIPNVAAKVAWFSGENSQFSSRHTLVYPTLLLNLVSREGTGGILPPTTEVPQIFALSNDALFSHQITEHHTMTWKLGVTVAPHFGGGTAGATQFTTIDVPLVYARTAAYYSVGSGVAGLAVDGPIWGPFSFVVDAGFFVMPGMDDGKFAVEQGTTLRWNPSRSWMVQAGYKLVVGSYPFGMQTDILPTADVQWAF